MTAIDSRTGETVSQQIAIKRTFGLRRNYDRTYSSFSGRYDSANQFGSVSLVGTLPRTLPSFGDVSLDTNGREGVIPLRLLDDFETAFQTEGILRYSKKGLAVAVDFGRKTWSATFNNQAFDRLLAPRWGSARVPVKIGGLPWFNRELGVLNFTMQLQLR